jgi:hypothetical protein
LTACFEFYPAARHLTKHSATWPTIIALQWVDLKSQFIQYLIYVLYEKCVTFNRKGNIMCAQIHGIAKAGEYQPGDTDDTNMGWWQQYARNVTLYIE